MWLERGVVRRDRKAATRARSLSLILNALGNPWRLYAGQGDYGFSVDEVERIR